MDGIERIDGGETAMGRDSSGRFTPGASGNPAGKRPGTRNRKTVLREALRDGEDTGMARIVIDKALAGDAVTARFCLGILDPKPRGRLIELDLPEEAGAVDIIAAFDATLAAMAGGEITPDEALTITRILDARRRAVETLALERRARQDDRETAAAPQDAPVPAPEPAVAEPPGRGRAAPVSLHSACILPTAADVRAVVAKLPRSERRRVAALVARRPGTARGAPPAM